MVYYSILYYLPIYFQDVRRFTPLASAALVVIVVIGQSLASVASGQYISRRGRYGELLWIGYGLWTLGAGLRCLFSRTIPVPVIAVILFIEGLGVGNCFQPSMLILPHSSFPSRGYLTNTPLTTALIASQAHCLKADRAVIISTRNFCRTLGGAFGLAAASAVFSNTLQSHLPHSLPHGFRATVTASIFKVPDLSSLGPISRDGVLDAYMSASKAVFLMWVPLMAACFLSCVFVQDRGLTRPDEDEGEGVHVALVGRDEENGKGEEVGEGGSTHRGNERQAKEEYEMRDIPSQQGKGPEKPAFKPSLRDGTSRAQSESDLEVEPCR